MTTEMLSSLKDVYGDLVSDNYWQLLKEKYPEATPEELLRAFQENPTCNYSFFEREPNIKVIAWLMKKQPAKHWQILNAGCGNGPEPYELAMRALEEGVSDFAIDAFDVSESAIAKARQGKFQTKQSYLLNNGKAFLSRMSNLGLAHVINQTATRTGDPDFIEYEVDKGVSSKISFSTHDIIDKPLQRGAQKYDFIICNNVLQHYPQWTRELILINILENMKDKGLLALEHEEMLSGMGMTVESIDWLKPYYEWRSSLKKFGLVEESVQSPNSFLPQSLYRYNQSQNPCQGKSYVIRDRSLVESK